MNFQVLLPILLFAAMGACVIAVTWRVVVAAGEARRTAQATRIASDVAHRADVCLTRLATDLDDLRHRRRPLAESATGAVDAIVAETNGLLDEAREAERRSRSKAVARLVAELERAVRALQLVEYGRGIVDAGRDTRGEGDQAMKRGYLEVVHARDAIRERGDELRRESAPASVLGAVDHR